MEEKKIIYTIILDIWDLAKKYIFKKLTDDEWEKFVDEGREISHKYKNCEPEIRKLYANLFNEIAEYKKNKEIRNKER